MYRLFTKNVDSTTKQLVYAIMQYPSQALTEINMKEKLRIGKEGMAQILNKGT